MFVCGLLISLGIGKFKPVIRVINQGYQRTVLTVSCQPVNIALIDSDSESAFLQIFLRDVSIFSQTMKKTRCTFEHIGGFGSTLRQGILSWLKCRAQYASHLFYLLQNTMT